MENARTQPRFISDVFGAGSAPKRHSNTHVAYQQVVDQRKTAYKNSVTVAQTDGIQQKQYARFYRKTVHHVTHKALATHKPSVAYMPLTAVRKSAPSVFVAHIPVIQKSSITIKKRRTKRLTIANGIVVLAIAMSGLLGAMAYKYHVAIQKVEAQPSANQEVAALEEQTDQTEDIEPTLLSETAAPVVAAGPSKQAAIATTARPYKISIPKLGIISSIISVGVTKSGAVNAPSNIWQVGWYNKSSIPSSNAGVVILNGHVHGPTKPGVFANLKNLKSGDVIKVSDTKGASFSYKVVQLKTYKANDGDPSMYQSASPDKQGLNLVTCDGKIIDNKYQDRLVVFTERI